ncbi:MAG: hypothetical protein R3F11_26160 [Verrucomicrobiales bacterium]
MPRPRSYAALNRRDAANLRGAGIGAANVHLLPNAVEPPPTGGRSENCCRKPGDSPLSDAWNQA